MKQYVITVMAASIVGAIITMLAPSGERGGPASHVRLSVGLVLILVCISPLLNLVRELREIDVTDIVGEYGESDKEEYESIFHESYSAAEIENLKSGIKSILKEKFKIAEDECHVSVISEQGEDGQRRLRRVFINLYGRAILKNTDEIEEYLSSLFGCEIVTAVG